jgi:hypothetical protein
MRDSADLVGEEHREEVPLFTAEEGCRPRQPRPCHGATIGSEESLPSTHDAPSNYLAAIAAIEAVVGKC